MALSCAKKLIPQPPANVAGDFFPPWRQFGAVNAKDCSLVNVTEAAIKSSWSRLISPCKECGERTVIADIIILADNQNSKAFRFGMGRRVSISPG
jgi:hypothetical protein